MNIKGLYMVPMTFRLMLFATEPVSRARVNHAACWYNTHIYYSKGQLVEYEAI